MSTCTCWRQETASHTSATKTMRSYRTDKPCSLSIYGSRGSSTRKSGRHQPARRHGETLSCSSMKSSNSGVATSMRGTINARHANQLQMMFRRRFESDGTKHIPAAQERNISNFRETMETDGSFPLACAPATTPSPERKSERSADLLAGIFCLADQPVAQVGWRENLLFEIKWTIQNLDDWQLASGIIAVVIATGLILSALRHRKENGDNTDANATTTCNTLR